MPEIILY